MIKQKKLFLVVGFLGLVVFFLPHTIAHAALINASGELGQYDANTSASGWPNFVGNIANDGVDFNGPPNAFGMECPSGSALDTVNHRLFVADDCLDRVLIYQLDSNNNPTTDTPAHVLGQANFSTEDFTASQSVLNVPVGLAFDPSTERLFVGDTRRVMIFDVAPADISDGELAEHILGQSDYSSLTATTSQNQFTDITDLVIDPSTQRLFVADAARVLVFDAATSSFVDNENAENVLGNTVYDDNTPTSSPSQNGFHGVSSVTIDPVAQRLFVADANFNRVLAFDVATSSISDGENAIHILGQAAYDTQTASTSQSTFSDPQGLVYDSVSQRLFVNDKHNNRVLVFGASTSTLGDGELALNVLGQPDFNSATNNGIDGFGAANSLSDPSADSAYDPTSGDLYVPDVGNTRVMVFPAGSLAISNGENATSELGETDHIFQATSPDYTLSSENGGLGESNSDPNDVGFNIPFGSALDPVNHRLFVSDSNNGRVLVYQLDNTNQISNANAQYVLGQPFFGASIGGLVTLSQSVMHCTDGVVYETSTQRLFVDDQCNNRVLVFNAATSSISTGENAEYVLGQSGFDLNTNTDPTTELNTPIGIALDVSTERLFVGDSGNNRVVIFDVATSSISSGEPMESTVLGQTDLSGTGTNTNQQGFNGPGDVAFDPTTNRLFVEDGNNRVMIFDVSTSTIHSNEDAENELGQIDFNSSGTLTNQTGFNGPEGLGFDPATQSLYVDDDGNARVMVFDVATSTIQDNENAENVLGQTDFVSSNADTTQNSLNITYGTITYDPVSDDLFVPDGSNNRIMQFTLAHITNGPTLLDGTVGTSYSDTLNVTSSQGTPSFSMASGSSLPSGLSLNASSGVITGSPLASGDFAFTVDTNDNFTTGAFTTASNFSLVINAASGGGGGGGSGAGATVGVASGGSGPITLPTTPSSTIITLPVVPSFVPPVAPPLPKPVSGRTAFLFVVEHVANSYGGTDLPSNFAISVKGTSVSPTTLAGSESGVLVAMKPGTYSVSQKAVAGYAVALSSGCAGTAASGTVATCVLTTNDLMPPRLTVIQNVVNNSFGTQTAANFTVAVSAKSPSLTSFAGNAGGVAISLSPGAYSVNEKSVAGYTITLSSGCKGTAAYGLATICTITATDPAMTHLIVTENVVNGYSGTKLPSNFSILVKGMSTSLTAPTGNASGTLVTMKPGTYSVTQKAVTGYAVALSSECAGTAVAGATLNCVITTTQLAPPTLSVVENVINTYFGTSTAVNFMVAVSGTGVTLKSFTGNASGTNVPIAPGKYSVTEKSVAGYTITLSSGCSGTAAYGLVEICTITASDPPVAHLIVDENVLNNYAGTKLPSNFTVTVQGTKPTPPNFVGNASGTLVVVTPGTYSVTQKAVTGYAVTLSSGCAGNIVAGEVVRCDVVTSDLPPETILVTQNVINAYGGTSTAANFTVAVSGKSPSLTSFAGNAGGTHLIVQPGSYSISQKALSGYSVTLSSGCKGTAMYGGSNVCLITETQVKPKGYIASLPSLAPPITPSAPSSTASSTPDENIESSATSTLLLSIDLIIDGGGGVVVTSTDVTIDIPVLPPGTIDTSNEDDQNDSGWVPATSSYPWILTPGQGIKTVSVSYSPSTAPSTIIFGSHSVFLDLGQNILSAPTLACDNMIYLQGYAFSNHANDPATVIKIQKFLNQFEGSALSVNGVYDAATQAVVAQFQLQYKEEVLQPWIPYGLPSINDPTSQTYKTTQRWINILSCPSLSLPVPQLP